MINAQVVLSNMISLLIGLEALGVEFFSIEQNEDDSLTFIPEKEIGMLKVTGLIDHLTEIQEAGYYKAQMVETNVAGKPTLMFHPIVEKMDYHPDMKEMNMN